MIGIYKITNRINGKAYIGQSINIKQRWTSHKNDAESGRSNAPIHRALRKYGIDSFDFEIIEECSQQSLNEREQYWIAHYNSTVKGNGYNLTYGGDCNNSLVNYKKIYKLWDEGLTVKEIATILQKEDGEGCRSTVLKYLKDYENYSIHESRSRSLLKSNQQLKNEEDGYFNYIKRNYNHIYQYDLEGNFINEWNSVYNIQENLNISDVCIYDCLNNKQVQSCGYQWKLEKKDKMENVWGKTNYPIPIIQQNLNGSIIASYASAEQAAKLNNYVCTSILKVCKGEDGRQTAYGYKWKYNINNWKQILDERRNKNQLNEML